VGVEGSAEQSEVKKFWMYEIKAIIFLNTSMNIEYIIEKHVKIKVILSRNRPRWP